MLTNKRVRRGHWTKENVMLEALKYDSRVQFENGSGGAYDAAISNGWLDDICLHMTELRKPKGHWNKETCSFIASQFNTKTEFRDNYDSAYQASHKNGWLNEFFTL